VTEFRLNLGFVGDPPVFGQGVDDNQRRLAEGMSLLQSDVAHVKTDLAHLTELSADIKTIKAAVTDQSRQLRRHVQILDDHETRLSGVEHAA